MFLRAVATCNYCLALGSNVAVVLALKALLYLALLLVSLALEDLALPNQTLVNNLVSILWPAELYNNARESFYRCIACQPSNVLDLCVQDEQLVVQQQLVPRFFKPVHVYCAGAYAVCDDAVGRDPYQGSVADAVDLVISKLL